MFSLSFVVCHAGANSEQAFFNVMLKDFGVKGVKVQEVLGLDDDLLAMLP